MPTPLKKIDAALAEQRVYFRGFKTILEEELKDVGRRRTCGDETDKLGSIVHASVVLAISEQSPSIDSF